ncbi:MAG: right-handed parallel beta-helix repeat-containing protein [Planctomycetota bacterium]|jgi:parallel beta-helix repeat protein
MMKTQVLIGLVLFLAGATIQSAINAAVSGVDDINVAPGLYVALIDFLGKEIDVHSWDVNDPAQTILDGWGAGPIVKFENCGSGARLRGFTIQNGFATYGGGISCEASSPTISNCIVTNNRARYNGAGIDLYLSEATIEDCEISDNCDVQYGGAISSVYDASVLSSCQITHNEATDAGGGIYCYYSLLTINNCFVRDNTVHNGPAGAVYIWDSASEISNCTIVDNTAQDNFGGIVCEDKTAYEPVIIDSILWNNGDDLFGCGATYSCIEDLDIGTGNIHEDPRFIGPHYLSSKTAGQLVDSPCIDAGSDPASAVGMDQLTTRSDHVPDTNTVDMGYHQRAVLPVTTYKLSFTPPVGGTITIDANLNPNAISQYTEVEIWANPGPDDPNYYVRRWRVDGIPVPDPHNPGSDFQGTKHTVLMDADHTVTVEFAKKQVFNLAVTLSGTNGLQGDVVTIETLPSQGFVTIWGQSDNDYSIDPNNTATMTGHKTVTVSFHEPDSHKVPGEYTFIQLAINAASGGDTVEVSPGVYTGFWNMNLDFQGKAITVASTNPDDPNVVATTIIDCNGGHGVRRAFLFQNGEGS